MNRVLLGVLALMLAYPMVVEGAVTVGSREVDNFGSSKKVSAPITFDASYVTGGETVNANQLGMSLIDEVLIEDSEGYLFDADIAANKQSVVLKVYRKSVGGTGVSENVTLKDLDAASGVGVQVYLRSYDGVTGHFEFVSPTNAHGVASISGTLGSSEVMIYDNDSAATGTVALYFDEDSATSSDRFVAVTPSTEDIFVPTLKNGRAIKVNYDDAAATNGVLVYFDEDSANAYDRLLFTSPTNADGTAALYSGEVESGDDLSGLTVNVVFIGK